MYAEPPSVAVTSPGLLSAGERPGVLGHARHGRWVRGHGRRRRRRRCRLRRCVSGLRRGRLQRAGSRGHSVLLGDRDRHGAPACLAGGHAVCGLLAARPRGTRPLVARAVFSCRLHAERSYLLAPQSTTMAATSEAPMVDEAILEKVAPLTPHLRVRHVSPRHRHSLTAMPIPILNHAEFAT